MRVYVVKSRSRKFFPFIAWLIMIFQGMNPFKRESYSHLSIMFVSSTGNNIMLDATGHSVRVRTYESWARDNKAVGGCELDIDCEFNTFLLWVESVLGIEYSKIGIVGLLMRSIGLFSTNKIGSNYKKMICSELVVNLIDSFYDLEIGDSDNYDLIMSWELAQSVGRL